MSQTLPTPSGVPLSGIVAAYLDDLGVRTGESHVTRSRFALDRLVRELGDPDAATLTAAPVIAYRAARLKDGLARATVNKELITLQAALSWAQEVGMIQVNPIRSIRALPVREADLTRAKRALTDEEVERFLAAARACDTERTRRGIRQFPLWLALLDTGARRGETLALRWCDVDLEGALVTFRAGTTKSGAARVVPIDAILVDELARLQREQVKFLGEDPGEESPVFLSPEGAPWTPNTLSNVERYFHRLRERARIAHRNKRGQTVTIHALRHTFGTALARSGARPEVVAKLMGHSDTKVTLAYYVHVEEDDMRAARAGRWAGSHGEWSQIGDSNPRPLLYESMSGGGVLYAAAVAAALEMGAEADLVDDCSAPVAPPARPARRAPKPVPEEPQDTGSEPPPAGDLVRLRVTVRLGSPLWWAVMEAGRGEGEGVERE